MPNALAVIALSERGTMFDPGPCFYMEKLAVTDDIADLLSLDEPDRGPCCARVAERRGVPIGDLMVVMLDRPRHDEAIARIRETGARIRLITDGDVAGVLMAVRARHRHRPAVRHRRHARGRARGGGDQVPRRRACSAGSGRATTTSATRVIAAGIDLDRVLTTRRPRRRRQLLLRRAPA